MIRFIQKEHSISPGATMIEVWDDNRFLCGIYAGSGRLAAVDTQPIVRIVSKHVERIRPEGPDADGVAVLEVLFR